MRSVGHILLREIGSAFASHSSVKADQLSCLRCTAVTGEVLAC